MNNNAILRRRQQAASRAVLQQRLLPLMVAGCFIPAAVANPLGPQVVNGNASFSSQGNILSITNTPGAIINWQAFSINPGEVTRFIQQNPHSSVLNRIVGQDPSQILGALQSNGRVFLVNPNGILFGQGAQVDVNGLVASTLNISNDDFINGRMSFKTGDKAAGLKNQGAITTPAGGKVYLIAPNVENSGIITSPKGEVLLAAGHTVQLVDSLDPNLQVVLSAPENEALNLGQVLTQGGTAGIFGSLIRQRGVVSADSAVIGENGKVVFKASGDALLEAGSRTTARGASKGGEVIVQGDRVGLLGDAHIDVSGDTGGGTVLLGGDYQGKNPAIMNARQTLLSAESVVKADAIQNGNGGKVIAWGDQSTQAYGAISARGGAKTGNGGFVETSAHYLDMQASVDTSAPNGQSGLLLLDPMDVYIADTDPGSSTNLGSGPGTSFTGSTNGDSWLSTTTLQNSLALNNVNVTSSGKIQITDPLAWSSIRELILNASDDVIINGTVSTGPGSLSAQTTGNVLVNGAISSSGTVDLKGNAVTVNASINAGTLGLRADGSGGNVSQTGGTITANSLVAYSGLGSVALGTSTNAVGTLAGYSGGGGFSFKNNGSLTVDTVSTTLAGMSLGIRSVNQPVSLTSLIGDITIEDSSSGTVGYGVSTTGGGNITLVANTGKVQQTTGKLVTTGTLNVTAATGIDLSGTANAVGILTASQTDGTAGDIGFVNNSALTLGTITQAATGAASISLSTTGANNINVNGAVTGGTNSTLNIVAGSSGAISGTGTLSAKTFNLQSGSIGGIGLSTTPLHTASIGGVAANADFNIGSAGGAPDKVYINHTGAATLASSFIGANAPVAISASDNLSVTSINTGTSDLKLSAGKLLTVPGTGSVVLAGANIDLSADRMDIQSGSSINAGSGTVAIRNMSVARKIELGSNVDTPDDALRLSNAELAAITAGKLKIGDTGITGDIDIVDSIAAANAGMLILQAGGLIKQDTGKIITATNLGIRALGDVTLTQANDVANIAAWIGDASNPNRTFAFSNGAAALNVKNGIDGMPGISINISGSYATGASGVIKLKSNGAITQSVGSTIGGKAVFAEGARVDLTQLNPTGIVAGKTTGIETGEAFKYKSTNGIVVVADTTHGYSGIETAAPNGLGVQLESSSSVNVNAPINAGSADVKLIANTNISGNGLITVANLELSAQSGIMLAATKAGTLKATNTGASSPINIVNTSTPILYLYDVSQTGSGDITINNTGPVIVHSGNTVSTTSGNILIESKATGSSADTVTVSGNVSSATGNITLRAGGAISGNSPATGSPGVVTIDANKNTVVSPPPSAPPPAPPSIEQCVSNPQLPGCGAVLPTLSQCTSAPTTPGCSMVLPTIDACVSAPSTSGCSVVLPTLSQCTASPATAGCSVVLPTLTQCTVSPSTEGCGVVLPTVNQCTTAPSTAGCSVVLPKLEQCISNPDTTGCVAVLPKPEICASTPTAPGCNVVLPKLETCIAMPTTLGCTVVLPTVAQCTTNPQASGCSVILPPLTVCTVAPSTAGCSVVLPTLSQCTSAPATTGCSAVLPTISQCTSAPATLGCGAVLPTLSQCTGTPSTAGCSAVLPTLSACTSNPATAGCSTVLPSLAQCTASPTLQGCSVVLPIANQCTTNPSAEGCETVLPTVPPIMRSALTSTVTTTSNTLVTMITTATTGSSPVSTQSQSQSQSQSGGGSTSATSAKKGDAKDDKKTSASTDDNGVKKNEIAKKLYCN
ncbi:filamentous hemagglutinin N-terminal domain-containing protein [Herbaspirillum sp. GCM10030257]|uniref:two-partner secretion domain-containing protein n=1 Tax=Herbaspirillum sp. GCM10030257 TaxID=3273393 RepID=UPI00360BB70F